MSAYDTWGPPAGAGVSCRGGGSLLQNFIQNYVKVYKWLYNNRLWSMSGYLTHLRPNVSKIIQMLNNNDNIAYVTRI